MAEDALKAHAKYLCKLAGVLWTQETSSPLQQPLSTPLVCAGAWESWCICDVPSLAPFQYVILKT